MSDIVERLRDHSPVHWSVMHEAAAEIERLRASLRHIASGKCVHPENEARQALQETDSGT